jgi:hypothetical protein
MAAPAAGMLGEFAVTGDLATAWATWKNAIKAGAAVDAGLGIAGAVADYAYKRSRVGEKKGEKHRGDFLTPPRKSRSSYSAPPFISPIKKSDMPKKNLYQGGTTRANYNKKLTYGGTVRTTYKKRLVKKNTKKGGSSRIFDMIAPPLTIYNSGYYPRCLENDGKMGSLKETTDGSGIDMQCLQFPLFTTKEIATYIMKSKEVPHALAWQENHAWKDEYHGLGALSASVGERPVAADAHYLVADKKFDAGVYGFVESIKVTLRVTNPNECPVAFDLMEVRPRHAITDLDQVTIASTVSTPVPSQMPLGHINPLLCLEHDWTERVDYINKRKQNVNSEWYPLPTPDDDSAILHGWKNQKVDDKCKYFNRYYKVLSHKTKILSAGEVFDYDVVVPGFGFNFDRYLTSENTLDVEGSGSTSTTYTYKLKEVQSTFTRFLMMKHRGIPQYEKRSETDAFPLKQKVYPKDLVLNIACKKYLRTRLVPKVPRVLSMKTSGDKDIDAFGVMTASQEIVRQQKTASDLIRFGGVQVTGVNVYPNLVKNSGDAMDTG